MIVGRIHQAGDRHHLDLVPVNHQYLTRRVAASDVLDAALATGGGMKFSKMPEAAQ